MCVALAALDATVWVCGLDERRIIPFGEFHRLPGDTPHKDSNLKPGELITHIQLPGENFAKHYQYIKVRDRRSYAFALVSVAAALVLDGPVIEKARIALGGVAHKPWRDAEVENFLAGKNATQSYFEQAANMLLKGAKEFEHNGFKIELAKRSIVRALSEASERQSPEPLDCYTYNRHEQL
jgi:xanthine dehydrogenase YagS FAD-binding subunit